VNPIIGTVPLTMADSQVENDTLPATCIDFLVHGIWRLAAISLLQGCGRFHSGYQ